MHYSEYKTIISPKNVMNVFRGCTHGCIYCDSRSVCYQFKHDFTDVEVKKNAPIILENQLKKKRNPVMILSGSMCDPYLKIEASLNIMRDSLKVIDKLGFGVAVLTKSDLVLRDLDLLKSINKKAKAVVCMTLTTFDEDLVKLIEPNVATTKKRFEVLKIMQDNGIPTVVWLCPILPFINDTKENLLGILDYCKRAGVYGILNFGMGLTLREGSREYFYSQLDKHFLGLKEKYIKTYNMKYYLESPNSGELEKIFHSFSLQNNIVCNNSLVFKFLGDLPKKQLSFFD